VTIEPIQVRTIGSIGTQWLYRFPNGYGASVIDCGYGSKDGLLELSMLLYYGEPNTHHRQIYHEIVNHDVLGWLNDIDLQLALEDIKALPAHHVPAKG